MVLAVATGIKLLSIVVAHESEYVLSKDCQTLSSVTPAALFPEFKPPNEPKLSP